MTAYSPNRQENVSAFKSILDNFRLYHPMPENNRVIAFGNMVVNLSLVNTPCCCQIIVCGIFIPFPQPTTGIRLEMA